MTERRGTRGTPAPRPSVDPATPGSGDGAAELLATATHILHVNGADSERTESRVRQIATAIGLHAETDLAWSSSTVIINTRTPDQEPAVRRILGPPSNLGLNRVSAVDAVADELTQGRLSLPQARAELETASALTPAPLPLFAAACAVGGCALAIILGVEHLGTLLIIAVSTGLGALVRRVLGRLGSNNFWQVAAAGLLAGLGGALSGELGLSSPLGLAAVCPCMVLVPGPHLLKGALDLATLRIPLGIARLTFACLTLAATASGLLVGLWLGGAELVADPSGRSVPIWVDVPAAGVVAVCYGIFYSAPLRILGWPFVVGMVAHALRWTALSAWGAPSWFGAGLACLLVGIVLYPVAVRRSIPFSAIGFASVVSLMPGVLVLRALGGLAELPQVQSEQSVILLLDTVNNLNGAVLTILAMTIGFLVPFGIWRRVLPRVCPAPIRRTRP